MTEHLPSEVSEETTVSNQELGIQNSNISNTVLSQAGRDSYKAEGNITSLHYLQQNYYVQKVVSSSSKLANKVETFEELEKALEAKYLEKFKRIDSLINELREQVEKQLAILHSQYHERAVQLFDELQSIIGHENDIRQIKDELVIYRKAADWLYRNIEILVRVASKGIFSGEYQHLLVSRKRFIVCKRVKTKDIYSFETKSRFINDLNVYLGWVALYIQNGSNPKDFNKSYVYLDFRDAAYKQAFQIMRDDVINPNLSGLPIEEARILARYINRFIIDRDISKDT